MGCQQVRTVAPKPGLPGLAGSVLGAAVIGMSWYGVNFLLGAGLHSYGFGQGGQTEFFLFLVANFLLLGGAAWRYTRETVDRAAAARPASQP